MKGKFPLSKAKLNAALLQMLLHPEVHLTYQHQTAQQGMNVWDEIHPPTNLRVKVDANQQTGVVDHIGTVVHELIHVVVMPMCLGWFTEDLEEAIVCALDAQMMTYIRRSPTRLHAWTEAINTKLKESDA